MESHKEVEGTSKILSNLIKNESNKEKSGTIC